MKNVYLSTSVVGFALLAILLAVSSATASPAPSLLADVPANARWHVADDTSSLAFLGGDQKERAVLVLKKSAVMGATVSITSDATKLTLRSGDSSSLAFPITQTADSSTTTLQLGTGTLPKLLINGDPPAPLQSPWRQIAASSDASLTIELEGTTFANIKYTLSATPEKGPLDPGPAPATTVPPITPPVAAVVKPPSLPNTPLDIARRSVFQIQVLDAEHHPFSAGSGFVLTEDGFAVTNYHVIQGAAGAQAIFGEKSKPVPIELWSIQPDADLALIRLPEPKADAPYPAMMVGGLPNETDPAWALGNLPPSGITAERGVVKAVRGFASLDDKIRSQFDSIGSDTRWIQTDCVINPSNSGGPLINQRGQVVGVNTWMWADGQNLNLALSAGHIGQLIRHRMQPPLTFPGAISASTASTANPTPWSQIPRPSVTAELLHETTASQTLSASKALATGLKRTCPRCSGSGNISVDVPVGTRYTTAGARSVYRSDSKPCDRCKGTGFERASDDAILRLAGNVIRSMTLLRNSDSNAPDAASQALAAIKQNVLGDEKSWSALSARSKLVLAQKSPEPGTPILVKMTIHQILPIDATRQDLVATPDGSTKSVLITDAPLADVKPDSTWLVGGLLSAPQMSPTNPRPITTIRAGLLLPP